MMLQIEDTKTLSHQDTEWMGNKKSDQIDWSDFLTLNNLIRYGLTELIFVRNCEFLSAFSTTCF
jgi:hypothetical protein